MIAGSVLTKVVIEIKKLKTLRSFQSKRDGSVFSVRLLGSISCNVGT